MSLPHELRFLGTAKGQAGTAIALLLCLLFSCLTLVLTLPEEAMAMNSTLAAVQLRLSSIKQVPSQSAYSLEYMLKKPTAVLHYFPSNSRHVEFHDLMQSRGQFLAAAAGIDMKVVKCVEDESSPHPVSGCPTSDATNPKLSYYAGNGGSTHGTLVEYEFPEHGEFWRLARLKTWLKDAPQEHEKKAKEAEEQFKNGGGMGGMPYRGSGMGGMGGMPHGFPGGMGGMGGMGGYPYGDMEGFPDMEKMEL